MAEKDVDTDEVESQPQKKSLIKRILAKLLKFFLVLLLITALIIGGFVLGVYLRILDVEEANKTLGLHKLPVVGEYFVKPADEEDDSDSEPGFLAQFFSDSPKEAEEKPPTEETNEKPKAEENVKKADKEDKPKEKAEEKKESKPVVLTKEEIEAQMKAEAEATKKRASKLARLYGNMKPAEAAEALKSLDDNMIVNILQRMEESQAAKILASFEPAQAARLTENIYNGQYEKKSSVPNP